MWCAKWAHFKLDACYWYQNSWDGACLPWCSISSSFQKSISRILGFVVIIRKAGQLFPLNWISCVFNLRLVCWRGSVPPPHVKTDECKDLRLPPSNDTGNARTYFSLLLHLFPLSLSILLFPTSIMCFQYIPVVSQQRPYIKRRRQLNLAHLRPICTSSSLPLSFSMGLWNCQSAVNKADLNPTIASQTALNILGLTETWINPEDYWPVSLLPFIAKTLERVVFNQLSSFLLKHNLLDVI